jgi:HicB-like protein involved in pilus formation
MSTLSLRLPESLHRKIRELAERDDISINQFIAMAVAEKTAALLTVDYLVERGRRGSAALFDRVLARVPDVAPIPGDELPLAKGPANTALQPTSRARKPRTKSRRRQRAARAERER